MTVVIVVVKDNSNSASIGGCIACGIMFSSAPIPGDVVDKSRNMAHNSSKYFVSKSYCKKLRNGRWGVDDDNWNIS